MQSWKTLSKEIILEHNKYLSVESHTIELPDGTVLSDWPWIETPDYVMVVPLTTEGKFLCFKQTKYAIEGTSLAPVGGYIETEEDPLSAAKRELLEETGYEAHEWIYLGKYRVDGNRGAGMAHLYLATNAKFTKAPHSDDQEQQELLTILPSDLESYLLDNKFKVLPWATAIAMALLFLANHKNR